MVNNSTFKKSFIVLFSVGILNVLAEKFYLYWTIWWFDILVHFLAGISVGMIFVVFSFFFMRPTYESKKKVLHLAFFFTLVVGLAWEVFEIIIEATSFSDGISYVTDTFSDIIIDLSGGIIGSIYSIKDIERNEK